MDSMNMIVAKNIRRLREEKKLSMDELVRLSGVSKSMLAQIERGDGNPTISTLWKIQIHAGGQDFIVEKGESIRFEADTAHSYKNVGNETAILHMILFNP